jgi:Tol biopolymer transport system component
MQSNDDIWIEELPGGPLERLTVDAVPENSPFWSPDGQFVAYGKFAQGLWRSRADGTGEPQLLLADPRAYQGRWSPDGSWIVYRTVSGIAPVPSDDIFGFRPGVDSTAVALIATAEFSEASPSFSPDGRWLAYVSNRTGRPEVYVSPYPNVDSTRVTVSRSGGGQPVWGRTGREIFFVDADDNLVAAQVETGSGFRVLGSRTLFNASPYFVPGGSDTYDVAPDDQRFLMLRQQAGEPGSGERVVLVLNFFELLRERLR